MVYELWFTVQGLRSYVQGLGIRFWGFGFYNLGLGFTRTCFDVVRFDERLVALN
jgi:hypothetical protein